jgi:hypothetical protein
MPSNRRENTNDLLVISERGMEAAYSTDTLGFTFTTASFVTIQETAMSESNLIPCE